MPQTLPETQPAHSARVDEAKLEKLLTERDPYTPSTF